MRYVVISPANQTDFEANKKMTDIHTNLLLCVALRCLILPCAGLFYYLVQMPILLASILVVSGQALLNSVVINLFRHSDP